MIYDTFTNAQASHAHSLEILDALYQYDDFMASIKTLADLGCGKEGLDLEWWATRTTRDQSPVPLNIKCVGIDRIETTQIAHRYRNITYQKQDFEDPIPGKNKFDVLWSHDSFQYVVDPFRTLANWRAASTQGAMLCITVPQSTRLEFKQEFFDQRDYCYWHWTLTNLIHVLAITGWNCRAGFFRKRINDPWISAVVYNSDLKQTFDPKTTSWYQLAESGLLPETAVISINRQGYLRQRDLVLPWLDKSLASMAQH